MSDEDQLPEDSQLESPLEGEHQTPDQKQAIFTSYFKLSEWLAWAQPVAMNMQRGRMDGVSEEVMVVNYVSRNQQ